MIVLGRGEDLCFSLLRAGVHACQTADAICPVAGSGMLTLGGGEAE
jgi:hypothetical protein